MIYVKMEFIVEQALCPIAHSSKEIKIFTFSMICIIIANFQFN